MNKTSSVLISRLTSRTVFANIIEQKKAVADGNRLRINYITDNTNSILATFEAGAVKTTPAEYQRYIGATAGPTLPDPPTAVAALSSSGEVIISFTPGADGGSPITDYKYSLDDGATYNTFPSPTGAVSTFTIDGLTNGTTYSVMLKSVNAVGESTIGSDVVYITPMPDGSNLRLLLDGAFVLDPSGLVWLDTSGKKKNGALANAQDWSVDNSGAYVFNGSDDYITVPSGFADVSAGITVLAFANFGASKDTWERIIDFGNGDVSDNIIFSRGGTGSNLTFQIYNGTTLSFTQSLTGGIIENGWGFYVARLDGSRYLLKNQNVDVSGVSTVLPVAATRTLNYIGESHWSGDDLFEGRMGLIAVYGSALSDAEITQFFNLYKGRYFSKPAAPTITSITAGDGQLTVNFTAGSDGGSAITNYEYSINGGTSYSAFLPADVASPVVISGLTNGVSYPVRLRAVNVMGSGAASNMLTATPVAPVNVSLPVITGKTLLFRLEGDEPSSYSGSGSTWFDIDGSEGTYNGTLVNTPTYDSSTAGGVFTFNSVQQEYIQIADNAALRANAGASNYKSVVMWVYIPTEQTSGGLFSKQSNLNDYDGFSLTFNTNRRLTLNMNGRSVNGNYVTPITNVYNLNQWTMISAIVCFGGSTSNPSKIYVNTTEVLSQANGEFNVVETNSIQFPRGIQEGNSYSSCSIGAVYYYNGVLTSSDISTLYNATKSRYGL